MDIINSFTSTTEDIRDAIHGPWGTEITKDYKLSYLGNIVIAQGNLETIKQKCTVNTYGFVSIGQDVYIAWIKI